MTRIGSETYGSAVGPFAGAFLSFGLFSIAVQVDAPVVGRMPVLVTAPITLKWVIPIEVKKD